MGKKTICNDILTGRVQLANVTSRDGEILTISGEPEDVTDAAIKAVMLYMMEVCDGENRNETAFEIKDKCRLTLNLLNSEDISMADIKYDIVEHIGVISEGNGGWKKELNLISWNGAKPKYDIRDWAPEHFKMGKGITLTANEAATLANLIQAQK